MLNKWHLHTIDLIWREYWRAVPARLVILALEYLLVSCSEIRCLRLLSLYHLIETVTAFLIALSLILILLMSLFLWHDGSRAIYRDEDLFLLPLFLVQSCNGISTTIEGSSSHNELGIQAELDSKVFMKDQTFLWLLLLRGFCHYRHSLIHLRVILRKVGQSCPLWGKR